MAGAGDQPAEAKPTQHSADAAFCQHDAELGRDRPCKVGPAPTHHALFGQVRPRTNPLGDLGLLLR